jgi:PAT family beta-lactamase induction signal transducer AmpG
MSIIGWWTGYSGPGYLAFSNADALGWNTVYLLMIAVLIILMLAIMAIGDNSPKRPPMTDKNSAYSNTSFSHWLFEVLIRPFEEFFSRNGVRVALTLLLFIFLFKIGEAFLGRMSVVFYKEVGFSNDQIATYSKAFGWFLTVLFTLLGSIFNTRFGVLKGLLIGGIAMASSNLLFALIAVTGPSETLFAITLIVDNFTAAFSSVALVAFLSAIIGRSFSASQYALFASIGNFGRVSLAGVSGYTVDWLGSWELFFIMTAIMVLPSLILLISIRKTLRKVVQTD